MFLKKSFSPIAYRLLFLNKKQILKEIIVRLTMHVSMKSEKHVIRKCAILVPHNELLFFLH